MSIKILLLCNYKYLPATVKVLETSLKAISWNLFQLFRRILNDVTSITKVPSLQCFISVKGIVKNQLKPGQGSLGDALVLSHCSLLINPWAKPIGALEDCSEGENNCWFLVFLCFLLTASLRRRRMTMYISLFTVAVPVNYTSEFLHILPANSGTFWSYYVYH